jgi:hypothetical protein
MRTFQLHPSATYARQYARGYILALFYWSGDAGQSIVVKHACASPSGWDLPSETYIQTSLEPECWG